VDASKVSQMKAIEKESRRLKGMDADLRMQADVLNEALGRR
jgi:putative transposase